MIAGRRPWLRMTICAAAVLIGPSMSLAGSHMEIVDHQPVPIWHWTLPGDAPLAEAIIIQGVRSGGVFRPESAYVPAADDAEPLHREFLPIGGDILEQASTRVFGAEARVATEAGTGLSLKCLAGQRPAGVVLSFEKAFPAGASFDIEIDGRVEGARFVLVRAGGDAGKSEDIIAETGHGASLLAFPEGIAGADADLVVVCPHQEATIRIAAMRLKPRDGAGETGIAAWIWKPQDWTGDLDALLARLREHAVGELYLQLPLDDPPSLRALLPMLRALQKDGIRLVAVEGDPAMVTDEGRQNALERARELARFRTENARLIEGVQYDVEPYLLPSHAAQPRQSWDRWAALLGELREIAGERISTVVPFWMIRDQSARQALVASAPHVEEYVVMAYRTDAVAVQVIAAPWLEEMAGSAKVRVALENGPLPVEYHRVYRRAETGQLRVSAVDGLWQVELLSASAESDDTGAIYAFSHEIEADPSRVTFAGDRRGLEQTGRTLLKNLAAWSNFRGLAYHAFLELSEQESWGGATRGRDD